MTGRESSKPGQPGAALDESGILLEFHRVGNVVKVTAVDPQSLVEATIVGDPAAGEQALAGAAIRKLRYILDRRAGKKETNEHAGRQRDGRGGTLV